MGDHPNDKVWIAIGEGVHLRKESGSHAAVSPLPREGDRGSPGVPSAHPNAAAGSIQILNANAQRFDRSRNLLAKTEAWNCELGTPHRDGFFWGQRDS